MQEVVMKSRNCKQGKGLGKAGKLCGVCGDTIRQNEAESSEGDHLWERLAFYFVMAGNEDSEGFLSGKVMFTQLF